MSGDPFLEIFAAWFLVASLLAGTAGVWIIFTRSPQEITALVDRVKSSVHVVKTKGSSAVLYGRSLVSNSPTTSEEPPLIIPQSLKA